VARSTPRDGAGPLHPLRRRQPDQGSGVAALLGFYLGDGCVSARRAKCDATYPGIIADVARVISAMEPRCLAFFVRAPGAVVVHAKLRRLPGEQLDDPHRRWVEKRYDYPRWQVTNNSEDIRRLCCASLELLDIPWRQSNWKTISVSTREGVARLDELIRPKA
jgi:hypothetical protein